MKPMAFRSVFRWRAALTLWLVAALLWAPIWGQWHGIAHQVQQALVSVTATSAPSVPLAAADQDHGHTQGSALCQVLDHLGHASGLALGAAQTLPLPLPAALPVLAQIIGAGLKVCWTTQARAPPHWI